MIELSILDQSPVVDSRSASDAIAETMELVVRAEGWGYRRYWFAEHHGSASFASASPALLMASAAARTGKIRLGSGGILLGNAPSLRIAEDLRVLETLAPGRIDAGLGRAPGGDARFVAAIGGQPQDVWKKLDEVCQYLSSGEQPSHQGKIVAVPDSVATPEIWVLGTSIDSAIEAGRRGLSYAFGSFIDPTNQDAALQAYHQHFVPSIHRQAPNTLIAIVAFVGETEKDAVEMSKCSERWFVESFLRGKNVRFPREGASDLADITPTEGMISNLRRSTVVIGSASQVHEKLQAMTHRYATNQFALVTITSDEGIRRASYQRIAEEVNKH